MNDIRNAFSNIQKALINQKPWRVKQGHGSFVTLDFGKRIRENTKTGGEQEFGEWHIWIYCCGWKLSDDKGIILVNCESDKKEIERLLNAIQGTEMTSLHFDQSKGEMNLVFASGLSIKTWPKDEAYEGAEYVMIFTPDKHVMTFGPNKELTYCPINTSGNA